MPVRSPNRVLLLLVVLMVLAAMLPLLNFAPNRLLSGTPIYLWALPGHSGWLLCVPIGLLLALACAPSRPAVHALTLITAQASLIYLLLAAGRAALHLTQGGSAVARTSPGSGLWLLLALCLLVCSDAARRLTPGRLWRWLLQAQIWIVPTLLLLYGALDALSLMKEYANRRDVFDAALGRHLLLLGGTLLPALAIGLPVGLWCYRYSKARTPVFTVLNIIQTIPAVALFGLLIAPLAGLGKVLAQAGITGISGIGLAPALIALVLYALLPLVRSVVAGLEQTPRLVLESARAMGMNGMQCFLKVEVPLALPVLLRGLKTVAVQTIGMSTIAALIGAGGFGSLVFQGLSSSALDLVLLGVIPTIALAVIADALLNLAIAGLEVKRHDSF
ncbi:ABC transporter permease [Erwinia sp. HR93]|uniref:ABC transporter permease n=1 Tax=Erwinia sp. HR93 TaxID=3094840 RepID=UPI002ADEE47E|nr:ABC transporter permease [Erwinia sp. HR93]MEA1065464.1 ABC transporter permease [Erwinia sp. HR93]